jgi:hypothetical protein
MLLGSRASNGGMVDTGVAAIGSGAARAEETGSSERRGPLAFRVWSCG